MREKSELSLDYEIQTARDIFGNFTKCVRVS